MLRIDFELISSTENSFIIIKEPVTQQNPDHFRRLSCCDAWTYQASLFVMVRHYPLFDNRVEGSYCPPELSVMLPSE